MTLEELNIKITADINGLRKELQTTNTEVNKFANQVEQSNARVQKSYESLASKIPWAMIVAGITKITKASVEAASALEEVQNVVDVSFGKSSTEIGEWAKQMKDSFGLSEKSAKEFSSTFKTIGDSMGLTDEASKTMSKNLTQLSADMASFYNSDAESTSNALQAIYTGNAQSLKQYGIVLSEATLQEYALANGMKQSYSEMSQAEKVLLRYQYVMDVTKNAQGDFARTIDSVANQMKLLKENGNELLQQLGTALQPITQTLLKHANELVPALSDLISAFGELTVASQPLTEVVTELISQDLVGVLKSITSVLKAVSPIVETIATYSEPIIRLVNALLMMPVDLFNQVAGTFGDVKATQQETVKLISAYEAMDDATAGTADNMEEVVESTKELRQLISGFDELVLVKELEKMTGLGGGTVNNNTVYNNTNINNNNTSINNTNVYNGSGETFTEPEVQKGYETLQNNGVVDYLKSVGVTDLSAQDVQVLSVIPNFNIKGVDPVLPDGWLAQKLGYTIIGDESNTERLLGEIARNTEEKYTPWNRSNGDLIILDSERLTGQTSGTSKR